MNPRVEELIRASSQALSNEGSKKVAETLLARLSEPAGSLPVVLVAGEDKRGKSSLVNALLQRPNMSPVGVDAVTGAPISFSYSETEHAAVQRYGEQADEEVDFETARQLATIQGNPRNEAGIRSVLLGIPSPLLRHINLVDTPGVGGLHSGHAELTLQSLQFADALLFVSESGAQFRAAELEFLRRASARIDTVVIVFTKIDANRGWRQILADNTAIFHEQAPRFVSCPIVPVSSLLALRSYESDDEDDAAEMLAESGIPQLQAALQQFVVARAAVLRDANVLREVVRPLAVAERSLNEKLGLISPSGDAKQRLEAEQQRLKELNEGKLELPRRLDTEIRKLTLQRTEETAAGLTEIRRRYEARLKKPSKSDMESLPGEAIADLTALASHLNEVAAKRLSEIVESLLEDIDASFEVGDSLSTSTASRLQEQLSSLTMSKGGLLSGYDKMSILSCFSSGKSLGGLISGGGLGVSAAAILTPPIGIAIGISLGALYAYSAFKGKSRTSFTGEFRNWLGEQCTQTQSIVSSSFQRELIDLQEEVRRLVRDSIAERERDISESLAEARRLLQSEHQRQEGATRALQERKSTVHRLRREVDAALKETTAAPPSSAARVPGPSAPVASPA
ncbi:MAG: dynamin family protein [Acidimicrobiales bacterium]|jgi:tRNA U34 5-carboxymethylaminomethyl modifying GTPase MnmE/TrmE